MPRLRPAVLLALVLPLIAGCVSMGPDAGPPGMASGFPTRGFDVPSSQFATEVWEATADVTVSILMPSRSGAMGEETVTFNVTNTGPAAVLMRVDPRGMPARGDVRNEPIEADIPPRATVLVDVTARAANASSPPGVYRLVVTITQAGGAPVSHEFVKMFASLAPTQTVAAPQLEAALAPETLAVRWGGRVEGEIRIRNIGTAPSEITGANLSIEKGGAPARGYVVALLDALPTVPAGGTATVRFALVAAVDADDAEGIEARFRLFTTGEPPGEVLLTAPVTLLVVPPATDEAADATPPPSIDARVALAVGATLVGAGATGVFLLFRRERWRYLFFAPFAAMYTRIAPSDVLEHGTREELHRLIHARPGIRLSELQAEAALHTGALLHHLRALERAQLVTSRREGPHRRFFPAGQAPAPSPVVLTATQQRILALLDAGPLAQRDVASHLGVSQQGANHHVKTLQRRGLVTLVQDGPRKLVARAAPRPEEAFI